MYIEFPLIIGVNIYFLTVSTYAKCSRDEASVYKAGQGQENLVQTVTSMLSPQKCLRSQQSVPLCIYIHAHTPIFGAIFSLRAGLRGKFQGRKEGGSVFALIRPALHVHTAPEFVALTVYLQRSWLLRLLHLDSPCSQCYLLLAEFHNRSK